MSAVADKPPLGDGQRTMFILGSFEKRAVDFLMFLLVLIELFSLDVTAEAYWL